VSWFSGLRTALGNSTTQAQAIQRAYNSSQQKVEELQAAALEACQGIKEGEAQAGSSMASRLRALGGHVTQHMRRALHLGVRKALGVVNLRAISMGYVVPVGVDDEVEMNRVDALAAPAAKCPRRRLHKVPVPGCSPGWRSRGLKAVGHSSPLDL
jgi:hypothetical protein